MNDVGTNKSAKERIREAYEATDMLLATAVTQPKSKGRDTKRNGIKISRARVSSLSSLCSSNYESDTSIEINSSPTKKKTKIEKKKTRSLKYCSKVEQTPPITQSTGLRHCTLCSGQVRPQMCGGNKHRWRCVAKRCRKWYGWVMPCDKVPSDLRKGRLSSLGELKRRKHDEYTPVIVAKKREVASAIKSIAVKSSSGSKKTYKKASVKLPTRELSPLSDREALYEPCDMEKKSRWWINEKRTKHPSPEREFQSEMVDVAAACKIISNAVKAAALSRMNESGTVNGTLDILMDSLIGSIGPLLTTLAALPKLRPAPQIVKQLWDSSAVHIPTFR